MDPVERLASTSKLAVPSKPAALAAWGAVVAGAKRAWPKIAFDEDKLAAYIGPRLEGPDLAAALAAAPAGDLAIAAMCEAQEPTAHAAFNDVLSEVNAAGSATRASKDQIDEVKQILRVQLLVSRDGKPPGIAGYKGKGPLRGWVRITATRELIRHLKKKQREQPIEKSLEDALGTASDPMLSQLKAEYRSEFATSLKEAIAALSAEDRTLLRQSIVEQLSIDAIGAAFGVHRATAARWLSRARAALVTQTRAKLAARLAMPVDQIDSVIRLVQSRLDASMVRYLKES
ncbi:MAG: sigma-70 family RNA polymerase sigma factor [Deltaproteobacteria bacterium]|nr:sigma-70 family RNA polymerase sigma factor [Deltaproteobacteria bacterium]